MTEPKGPSLESNAEKLSLDERKRAFKSVVEMAMAKYDITMMPTPMFQPDGRGGFFITCRIDIKGNEER